MELELPEVGVTYEKHGEQRQVLMIHYNERLTYPDVVYRVKGKRKEYRMWSIFWKEWMKDSVVLGRDGVVH